VEGKVDIDLDTRLNHRILDLRKPTVNAIFWIQHSLVRFAREYLEDNRFVEIHTPKLVAEATEGGANLFEVKYFEKKAYLAQSPQFYKQLMLLAGFGRVFEIAPVFRAEKHNTRRHINEYTSFDFEMAWIRDVDDIMKMEENMLHHSFKKTRAAMAEHLETLEVEIEVPKLPFKRIKYAEAVDLLNEVGKDLSITDDLDPEAERILGKIFPEKFSTDMVFITHYPLELRPAYTMPSMTDDGMTESFDLTYKGMEITTGGQRIHLYDLLVERFKAKGFNPDAFAFYLDPFKYGAPPHGGLGLGVERLTMQLLGIQNIREATLLPRDRDRLTP
ncbi:MAG: aspartate--tRNA(Asn) ligase, partial [Candidatus Thorarchaeota archaeon]|nr:aspartate--tRNA(Asn) ligase [Candidatus Thorarchaeota archaeon]